MREKAPFIWTETQPVDPFGIVKFVTDIHDRTELPNRWLLFRRAFDLTADPESASFSITMDGRYRLHVNGTVIGQGPARCSPVYQRYDTWDIAPYLREGRNVIAVLAHVYGMDTSWYERVQGLWNPTFGDGGLWAYGDVEMPGSTLTLKTDLEWRCLEPGAWRADTPPSANGHDFIEVLDASRLPEGWMLAGFDDRGWDKVQIQRIGGEGTGSLFGAMITEPFPQLMPNILPACEETLIRPERIAWIRQAGAVPEAPLHDQIYAEPLGPLAEARVEGAENLLTGGEGVCCVQTAPGAGVSILFDFARLTTIRPVLEIEAEGGEEIDIAVVEKLPDEWGEGGPSPESRPVRHTEMGDLTGLDAHLTRYIARPGAQRFERFQWQAAKWMQVTIRNAEKGLRIRFLGGNFVRYPAERQGAFECSDPVLNQVWDVGQYTLRLCMHDAWEDCPSREQRQWLGDATVEHVAAYAAFGDSIEPLNAEFLRKAAESQRPDGLNQLYAPGNHKTNGFLIPDWTLQWMLNARNHYALTGDLDLIEEIYPSMQKALAWFERCLNANGLVSDMPYWHFMDHAGLGKAEEACTLNAQLAGCFIAAADLAAALEMPRAARRYRDRAKTLQTALNARHWDGERGVYVDMVQPETGVQRRRVSQHANAAMILFGNAPAERWASMIDWITDPGKITMTAAPPLIFEGEMLDEETGVVGANTFYSHFVYEALKKAGRADLVLASIRGRYGPMLARGATTLWESFNLSPISSVCHGFSASPVWQLTTAILGFQPGEAVLRPDLQDLDWARGVIPFRQGGLEIELKRTGAGFTVTCKPPAGLSVRLEPPTGYVPVNAEIEPPTDDHLVAQFERERPV